MRWRKAERVYSLLTSFSPGRSRSAAAAMNAANAARSAYPQQQNNYPYQQPQNTMPYPQFGFPGMQ